MTLEAITHHTQAVKRGASRPLVITNMPFGRCEGSPCEAPKNAQHLVKEGGAGCVQVEGPSERGKERAETTTTIVDGGIAVAGHIGLRSQHTSAVEGFRAQGRTAAQGRRLIEDALAVQKGGVVLECVHYHYRAVHGLELLHRRAGEGPDEAPADLCQRRDQKCK
ncbi:3-methyl-2-oxobutanoate hydroxymethyltransferase [Phytophthora ramorum]|uniref:3-methyl-2-oxobutanoate hydroxymethyltransferase n=1 Tax=Phytophthora ramorum TaxID=164328 RepID=UPI0030A79932|nr:3-methyl-2-oxobutanoate hydroxymethyltransferase [Phytophthora ramorum]